MGDYRVGVIVSSDVSDIYFANQLAKRLPVVGIVVEQPRKPASTIDRLKKITKLLSQPHKLPGKLKERKVLREHFQKTATIDRKEFGADGEAISVHQECLVINTDPGVGASRPEYVAQIRSLKPDVIALCGGSILKGEILSIPPKGILNLHGGLSQLYRGVCTTLWSIVNNEPETIGATVHFVNPGIDDGDIVYQGRPKIDVDDDPESLYAKVVKLGVDMMCKAIEDIADDRIKASSLEVRGDLYLLRMVTASAIEKAWNNIEQGVIQDYLARREEKDNSVIAMMQNPFKSRF